jgi:SseB protein N-terminal domain
VDAEWQPANTMEASMLAALEAGDGARYAQLLRSATLYLPVTEKGDAEWPGWLPPIGAGQTVAFTSPEALFSVFGPMASGYEERDLAALRMQYGDGDQQLVIDPNTPVGTYLSFNDIDELASGKELLMPMHELEDSLIDGVLDEVRTMCLNELGSDAETAAEALDERSANELEARLLAAVDEQDFDAFVFALVASDVVVLTTRPVPNATQITSLDLPWRVVGGEESPVLPVFTSTTVSDRIAPNDPHRLRLPFMTLLTHWPSDEHLLLVNPGTVTELTVPGPAVAGLLDAAKEAGGGA